MELFSTIISTTYLLRSYLHIAYRSSWYISLLLLCFFITSTYEITYLDFIYSPGNINLELNGVENIISSWFSGSSISLLMSGLLFFIVKSNLYRLSYSLIIELFLIALSSSYILLTTLEPLNFTPIIISIWIAFALNIIKNKSSFKVVRFTDTLNKDYIKNNLNLLLPIFFLIIGISSNSQIGDLGLMSNGHILRLIFFFLILFISVISDGFLLKKIFTTVLPIVFIYLGIIASSILSNNVNLNSDVDVLSFECLTSIALFPIIEVIISRYHQVGAYQSIFSLFKLPNTLFKLVIKLLMISIIISYCFYLITQ